MFQNKSNKPHLINLKLTSTNEHREQGNRKVLEHQALNHCSSCKGNNKQWHDDDDDDDDDDYENDENDFFDIQEYHRLSRWCRDCFFFFLFSFRGSRSWIWRKLKQWKRRRGTNMKIVTVSFNLVSRPIFSSLSAFLHLVLSASHFCPTGFQWLKLGSRVDSTSDHFLSDTRSSKHKEGFKNLASGVCKRTPAR